MQPEPGIASVRASETPPPTASDSPLSAREREVASLVAAGLSNRQISEQLMISERTVHGHVASILSKLDFRRRSQIAVWTVQHRMATPPEG